MKFFFFVFSIVLSITLQAQGFEKATNKVFLLPAIHLKDTSLRMVYHDLGVDFYMKEEDEKAIFYFQKEIEIALLSYSENADILYNPYLNISESFFWGFENYDASIEYALKALATHPLSEQNKGRANNSLAAAFESKGDFRTAEQHYLIAVKAFQLVSKKDNIEDWLAQSFTGLGRVYSRLGQPKQALFYYKQATILYQKMGDKEGLAVCFSSVGTAFAEAEKPQYDSALFYLEKSLWITQQHEWNDYTAANYNNIGWILNLQHQYQTALPYLNKALKTRQNLQNKAFHHSYAEIYDNLGDTYKGQQQLKTALTNYQLAVLNKMPQYQNTTQKNLPNLATMIVEGEKGDLLTFFQSIAETYYLKFKKNKQEENLNQALAYYKLADQLIDLMRREHKEDQSKLFWRKVTRPIYEGALEAAYASQRLDLAFYFMEKSRAVLLLDELKNKDAKQLAGLPDDLLRQEEALKKAIFEIGQKNIQAYIDQKGTDTLKLLQEELLAINLNYDAFIETIEKKYPAYYAIKYDAQQTSIEEISNTLTEMDGLIEFFVTDSYIYILSLQFAQNQFIKIVKPDLIHQDIPSLLELLYHQNRIDETSEIAVFDSLAHLVYNNLFESIPVTSKKISIIPDGILSYLPFQVLRSDKTTYWIEQISINYAYSASTLIRGQQRENNLDLENLLAIAPVHFDSSLAELRFSLNEIEEILQLIEGKSLVKSSATTEQFLQSAPKYRVLHFSTHASIGDSLYPWIAFHGEEKLYLPNLYHLPLQADLAVLSACQTNQGNFQTGEGVMSIARGLAYTGIPSLVSTMWSLNEQASREITVEMYKNLTEGLTQDEALRQSQLKYLKRHQQLADGLATPHYWAAFIHIGNTEVLHLKSASKSWFFMFGGLMILCGFGRLMYRFSKW